MKIQPNTCSHPMTQILAIGSTYISAGTYQAGRALHAQQSQRRCKKRRARRSHSRHSERRNHGGSFESAARNAQRLPWAYNCRLPRHSAIVPVSQRLAGWCRPSPEGASLSWDAGCRRGRAPRQNKGQSAIKSFAQSSIIHAGRPTAALNAASSIAGHPLRFAGRPPGPTSIINNCNVQGSR